MEINSKNMAASTKLAEDLMLLKQFLDDNYLIRRNVLSGMVEYANKSEDGTSGDYYPLTEQALNSMIIRAACEGILEKGNPQTGIKLLVNSDEVPTFDPIAVYLNHLPKWDGHNYVADLFSRIPGISSEQASFLAIWLRSAVAHWLQMDMLHGNECVPILIGGQGCGKTTFQRRLLPPQLRGYYLDHLNLSNKFDKEMALTNNLIVNIDEVDATPASQQAMLKQTLSKNKVNGRPIFGKVQQDRPRYASIVATTNNPQPLKDVTGSRRFLCLSIPEGMFIDNTGDINYDQLYAQLVYELREQKAPYWFNNEEVERIQKLNLNFMELKGIDELVVACYRKPRGGEKVVTMNTNDILKSIHKIYPSVDNNQSTKVHLGTAMKKLGFEKVVRGNVAYYRVVPVEAA